MVDEFWKNSPFGEDSIFHPSWEEKQEEERLQNQQKELENLLSLSATEGIEVVLSNNQIIPKVADGYYYAEDGSFYGKHGTCNVMSSCWMVGKITRKNRYHSLYNTKVEYENAMLLGGTARSERSYCYAVDNVQEAYA